jgi:hypothetical protein
MTAGQRTKRVAESSRLAEARANLFALNRITSKGDRLTGFKLVRVTGERHRNNLLAKGARPVLSTREWDEIGEEVGLR